MHVIPFDITPFVEDFRLSFLHGAAITAAVFFFFAFFFCIGLICYIFQSIGLYSIAKRRGLRLYGFAWVPVLVNYTIGSIADHYDEKVNGEKKHKRALLLVLDIILLLLSVSLCIISTVMAATSYSDGLLVAIVFLSLATMVFSVVYCVYMYIALYKVYKSCNPNACVVFIVLSILFSITTPFFLFAVRNQMKGLPTEKKPEAEKIAAPEEKAPVAEFTVPVRHHERDYNGW